MLRAARACGKSPILWSAAGADWKARSAEPIAADIRRQVRGGDVVLLHDGGHRQLGVDRSASVAAAGLLLDHYVAEGWEFCAAGEMMGSA